MFEVQTVKYHQRDGCIRLGLCYVAGRWEYPSPVDPSHPPSESEAGFASSAMLRSSSSDSSNSSSSSAAERRDSTEFGTLMESVCGSWHNPAKESHAEAAGEAQPESGHCRSSLPQAHSSTAAPGPGGAPSTAVADSGNIGTTAAAGSDGPAASTNTAGSDASAATAAATDAERANHDMDATAGIGTGSSVEDTSRAGHCAGRLPSHARGSAPASENAASEPGEAMALAPAVAGHDSLASSTDSCATSADDHQASDPGGRGAQVDSKQAESPICRADGETKTTAAPEASSRQAELSSKATEPSSQVTESASELPTTPPKPPKGGSPMKGGLVNVQRPAVKGYSIHRSDFWV